VELLTILNSKLNYPSNQHDNFGTLEICFVQAQTS